MLSERFTVGLTPLPTAARVATQRSSMRWRVISAIVSLAVLVAIQHFYGSRIGGGWLVWMWVLWGLSTAGWLTVSALGLARAKRDLASIGHGDALVIDGHGMEFLHPTPVRAAWSDITALKITGASLGAGPNLVMEVRGETAAKIPLSFLDAMPAAIDSATSARSLGRVRVDLSDMDRML